MPSVLRAYGGDFDVDTFLADFTLPVCAVKRRGDSALPASRPDGRRHERSGIHVPISDAGFDEFPRQVEETTTFLSANAEQVRRLVAFPGVDGVTLDFGIVHRDVAVQIEHLPAELVRLAGSLGLAIELSRYPAGMSADDA